LTSPVIELCANAIDGAITQTTTMRKRKNRVAGIDMEAPRSAASRAPAEYGFRERADANTSIDERSIPNCGARPKTADRARCRSRAALFDEIVKPRYGGKQKSIQLIEQERLQCASWSSSRRTGN